jgi:hypothetical protein
MTDREYYLLELKNPDTFLPENIEHLRNIRDYLCFRVVNRGGVWYATLTEQEKIELMEWYVAWLNITETKEVPQEPSWLK